MYLSQHAGDITERDIFKQPLTAGELKELLGDRPASELFSTKSPRYKALGLEGKNLSNDDLIRLMAEEPYLVRRPTFLIDGRLVVGMDTKQLDAWLRASNETRHVKPVAAPGGL